MYNGSLFGSNLLIFPLASSTDFDNLKAFIKRANQDARIEDIKDIFFIPYIVIDVSQLTQETFDFDSNNYNFYTLPYSHSIYNDSISFAKDYTVTGYTIKNNKLKCYPYQYLYITNNNGDNTILKFEDFSGDNVTLDNIFAIVVGGSGRLVPRNYKGVSLNFEEGVSLGKLPTCQWSSDSYTNWLTQNAVNNEVSNLRTNISMAKSALNLDFGSALTSGAENILDNLSSEYQAQLTPNKISGTNTGDVIFNGHKNNYEIWKMHPKIEYLRILDDYLSRFGYKVNRVFTPNISGRRNWNYVEIGSGEKCAFSNVNATFGVPQNDLNIINEQLQTGLTIWSDIDNIGDYSLTNDIV